MQPDGNARWNACIRNERLPLLNKGERNDSDTGQRLQEGLDDPSMHSQLPFLDCGRKQEHPNAIQPAQRCFQVTARTTQWKCLIITCAVRVCEAPSIWKCSLPTDSKRASKACDTSRRKSASPRMVMSFSLSLSVCLQPQEAEFCIFRGRNNSLISLVFMPVSHFLPNRSCSPPTHCITTPTPLSLKSARKKSPPYSKHRV